MSKYRVKCVNLLGFTMNIAEKFPILMWNFVSVYVIITCQSQHTQWNLFRILLNQTEIRLYIPCTDWFGTKLPAVWFQINRENGKYNLISVALQKLVGIDWFWLISCCPCQNIKVVILIYLQLLYKIKLSGSKQIRGHQSRYLCSEYHSSLEFISHSQSS